MNIEFKNPPTKTGLDKQETAKALMARRGEWALVATDCHSSTAHRWKQLPGFEAKSSSIGKTNGKFDIYVRYTGKTNKEQK